MKFLKLGIFGGFVTSDDLRKPNVILLLTDDMGIGDIRFNNKNGKIKTPNLDELARTGVNFLDGHSGSSRCAPSRYNLMTGRYIFDSQQVCITHFIAISFINTDAADKNY